MNNVAEIKAKAKKQIIELLKFVDCYNFEEKYIDKWLDEWEKACSPQIEAIAEKSPYYDGNCKIVFPSEYPREINMAGINDFMNWVHDLPEQNIEEAKVNGRTGSEIKALYYNINDMYKISKNSSYINIMKSNIPDDVKEIYSSIIEQKDALYQLKMELARDYDVINGGDYVEVREKFYNRDEYEKSWRVVGRNLSNAIYYSTKTQLVDERTAKVLHDYFPQCRFSVGQKLSRAVNNIATKYGLTTHPDWNREFAKFADAINPLVVTKWTVLSWHPMDYLTFCFGNSWSTCSNIDKRNKRGVKIGSSRSSITSYVDEDYVFRGEHAAAALSYMFDKTSFIYYTVNHRYAGTEHQTQNKESRIVFSLNEEMNTLLQSRLYPQCNDDNPDDSNYRIPREIVQKVIADSLGVPNLWKMKKGRKFCCDYAISTGVHYPDYTDERNKECNISWLGEEPKQIKIGHYAICPNCGEVHDHTSSLNCRDCDPDWDRSNDDDNY